MFRVSDNALNRWWRSLVAATSLSLLLFLPVFLEIHHSCRLQYVPSDSSGPSSPSLDDGQAYRAGTRDICESCVLMRTLLADEQGEVVWGACTVVSIGGCVCAEELIAENRAEGSPPPRAPPSGRQHPNA
jgi:hypothetical protein